MSALMTPTLLANAHEVIQRTKGMNLLGQIVPRDQMLAFALAEALIAAMSALRYALPLLKHYGHTQGDNAEYHAKLIAPVLAALGEGPATASGNQRSEGEGQ